MKKLLFLIACSFYLISCHEDVTKGLPTLTRDLVDKEIKYYSHLLETKPQYAIQQVRVDGDRMKWVANDVYLINFINVADSPFKKTSVIVQIKKEKDKPSKFYDFKVLFPDSSAEKKTGASGYCPPPNPCSLPD